MVEWSSGRANRNLRAVRPCGINELKVVRLNVPARKRSVAEVDEGMILGVMKEWSSMCCLRRVEVYCSKVEEDGSERGRARSFGDSGCGGCEWDTVGSFRVVVVGQQRHSADEV